MRNAIESRRVTNKRQPTDRPTKLPQCVADGMTGYLSSALYLLPSFSRYADICTGVPQNKMPRATIVVKRLVVKEGRRRLPSAIKFLTKARLRYLSSTHDDHDGQIVIAVRELPPCPHSQQLYGL